MHRGEAEGRRHGFRQTERSSEQLLTRACRSNRRIIGLQCNWNSDGRTALYCSEPLK